MTPAEEDAALDAANVLASLASHSPTSGSSLDTLPFTNSDYNSAHVKQEPQQYVAPIPSMTSELQNMTDEQPAIDGDAAMDEETARTIAALGKEFNTRVRGQVKKTDMIPTPDFSAPELSQRLPSKKRAAPSLDLPSGIKKPPPKKRKSEAPSDRGTPLSERQSPTPSSTSGRKSSKTPAPKIPGPGKKGKKASSSPVVGSPADSDGSDTALYCICRKPDDHTWMIACDGPCGDWFHGRCVNMQKENQALVDKYICPNCTSTGLGITTWKPMCRAEPCRKPAILKKGKESKYCSNDCGLKFIRSSLRRAAGQVEEPGSKRRLRASLAMQTEDDGLDRVGGPLKEDELKALVDSVPGIEDFRRLGSNLFLTPPASESKDTAHGNLKSELDLEFTESESERLAKIAIRKGELRQRRLLLKDRGTFVAMMRARVPKIAEKLNKKERDVCGFDSFWSLDDISFAAWRDSEEGKVVFGNGVLEVPADLGETTKPAEGEEDDEIPAIVDEPMGICLKKGKCTRHGTAWSKLVLDDVRFESSQAATEMRQIDSEEKEIRQRAETRIREKESSVGQPLSGWVEVVYKVNASEGVLANEDATVIETMEDIRPAYEASAHTEVPVITSES